MNYRFTVLIILSFLGAAQCFAQEFSCRVQVGGVLPLRRTFAAVEVTKQIAPRYAVAIAGEVSVAESNVMPKLTIGFGSGLSLEAGFGWGHHWRKANCDDHNFHTYTLGLMWSRPVSKSVSFFAGPSMFWRSYQAHIGLHRGTLRLNAGFSYRL
jgi:hypothetical protein